MLAEAVPTSMTPAGPVPYFLWDRDIRDLVDLYWIADSGIDVLASLSDAHDKDGGIEPSTLAWVLESVALAPERLMLVRPVTAAELARSHTST